MKKIHQSISLVLAGSIFLASCSSTTLIQSNPPKAKLYLDGEFVGETPYVHRDTKIVGSSMVVKLEKEGCKPLITTITKDEEVDIGAIIGGLFVMVPFLWTMKYKPVHTYGLLPISVDNPAQQIDAPQSQTAPAASSKFSKLRDLKKLLDDKIITQEEFEKEKLKVLEEKE